MEGPSRSPVTAGLQSSGRAKEAWDAYAHANWAPLLATALSMNGKEDSGEEDAAALLNQTLEQIGLLQQAVEAARFDESGNKAEVTHASVSQSAEPARAAEQAASEQSSSQATIDEALWAALAAAACRSRASAPGASGGGGEAGPHSSPGGAEDCLGRREGSCSPLGVSSEGSEGDPMNSWVSTFASSSTVQSEVPSFNGTFRARQRVRRTVRVVRSPASSRSVLQRGAATAAAAAAVKPSASTAANGAAVGRAGTSSACTSALEAPGCGGSPRRTRKKRAAALLMDGGGVSFHSPSSTPTAGHDVGNGSSGRQRSPSGFSPQCPLAPGTAASSTSTPSCAALPLSAHLQTPPSLTTAGLMSPLRSHRLTLGTPSTSGSSGSEDTSQPQGSPRSPNVTSLLLPDPLQKLESPKGELPSTSSCWGRPPILLAAATGRSDVVRHLLASASQERPAVQPLEYGLIQQSLEDAAQQAASLGMPFSGRAARSQPPGPLLAAPPGSPMPDPLVLLHCTALLLAALHGHASAVEALLTSPTCSIRARNAQGATALHMAAQEGCTRVVSALARAPGCDLDARDYGGRTPLHFAASAGASEDVNELWCRGCSIEPADASGWTALHYAAEAGHTQVVANLVIAGCHVHGQTAAGWTAAHLAAYSGHAEALRKLLLGGYEVDCASGTGGWTALHLAVRRGHMQAVQELLKASAHVRIKCDSGANVLHCAAESGCSEVFDRILEVGDCDLASCDTVGAQLVHSAAMGGNGVILQKLLDLGAVETATTSMGRTCLHYAAHGGHVELSEWLLNRGAQADQGDCAGITPLMLATEADCPQLVSLLLEHGADLHARSAAGCTPLHFATCSGAANVVGLLLERGADPGAACQRGATALHHAAEADRPDVLAQLLQVAGEAMIRGRDALGWTALHYAAMHQHHDCAALLVQVGSDVNAENAAGLTPLHVAASAQSSAVAGCLLASGCDGGKTDAFGRSALHYAAQTANWPLFSTLYAHPACLVMQPDDRGLTPLHYAVEGGSLNIVTVLLVHLESLSPGQAPSASNSVPSEAAAGQASLGAKSCPTDEASAGCETPRTEPPGGEEHSAASVHPSRASEQHQPSCDRDQTATGQVTSAESSGASSAGSFTPLHVAVYKGHAELIPYLLRAGFRVTAADSLRRTPLHYAAMQGCPAFEPPSAMAALSLHPLPLAAAPEGPGDCEQATQSSDASDNSAHAAQSLCTAGPNLLLAKSLSRQLSNGSSSSRGSSSGSSATQPGERLEDTMAPPLAASAPHQTVASEGNRAQQQPQLPAQQAMQQVPAHGPGPAPGAWPAPVPWAGLMQRVRVDYAGAWELLMVAGADVSAVDAHQRTALHYAAGSGERALLERLLELGEPVDAPDGGGWTPLLWAAAGGHAGCVAQLLEAGAWVGVMDGRARTPLHWAAERGWADTVTQLVSAMSQSDLDLHMQDKDGSSPAALAAAGGQVECVARILDSTATLADSRLTALHLAVQDGLEPLVSQLLLLPGAEPDCRDKDGLTPLHWAASKGSEAIVGHLLAAGADVNAVTNDSWTALHEASLNGHTAVVARLLQAGAQVNMKTSMGLTAMHNAATNGHAEIVDALLTAGAAPNARALSNATAVFCAAGAGHTGIVRRLLAAGSEVGVAAGAGATALHAGAGAGHLAIVQDLLDAHADVDMQAQNGATALHSAAGGGHDPVVKALLAARADADVQNSNCNTALHLASGKGHLEVVESLLEAGANAHIRNAKGWAPVHSAAAAGHLEVVLRLVAAGAAPRSRPDLDVLRMLSRKTTYRPSYVEGRLRLAEKERQRVKSKGAAGAAQTGPSQEELAALEVQANANMAALLQEEEVKKDVEEKKKNKKKDKKKRKGKKGDQKDAEEDARSMDDIEAKQSEAAAQIETESAAKHNGSSVDDTAGSLVGAEPLSPVSTKEVKNSNQPPGKTTKKSGPDSAQAEAACAAHASPIPAAKGAAQGKQASKISAGQKGKAVNPRPSQASTIDDTSAAADESGASEWQSVVGAAQRKARRPSKSHDQHQPGGEPHHAPAHGGKHRAHQQPQPPPPPPRAAAQPASSAAGKTTAPAQEARVARSQPRGAPAALVKQARSGAAAPLFAAVARPVHERSDGPVKVVQPQPAAPSAPGSAPWGASAATAREPLSKADPGAVAARAAQQGRISVTPAKGASTVTSSKESGYLAAGVHAPLQFGTQPIAPIVQQGPSQRPLRATTAAMPTSNNPATQAAPMLDAAESAVPLPGAKPSAAPSSGLSALAPTWHPLGAVVPPLPSSREEPSLPAAGRAERNAAAAAAAPQLPAPAAVAAAVPRELPASMPISTAPAGWRSGLRPHNVDWSFPRNGSGASLSSLAPSKPQGNGVQFPDAASDRVTCSSLESSASLCLGEGLLGAEPPNVGSSPKSGAAASSRLQHSSLPLGHMSMGNGGIHPRAGAGSLGVSSEGTEDYAAVLNDIWSSPQGHHQQQQHGPEGSSMAFGTANTWAPPTDAPAANGTSLKIRQLAEAYQLTCPITRELMRDPVVASDGYTYERAAIEAWMAASMVSPRTGQPLKHCDLVPNLTLRASISILIPRSCLGQGP